MLKKPHGVRLRQRLMSEALAAGDRKAARTLARRLADYRRGERREPEPCDSDWTDRCGWAP
jgi:hypothetical protein